MISVVIPLYNKARLIKSTLNAVLNQSYQDFEIVVVDDGSTDGSANVVQGICDPRIRLVRQANAGVSAARNRGIAEARGEYVAFLDADDEWKPDYLEAISGLINKYHECGVYATRYDFCNEHGKHWPTKMSYIGIKEKNDGILDNYFHVASNSDAPLWTSVVTASKDSLNKIGGFPVGVVSGEDLLTWARLACDNKIAYLNEVKATYYTPTTGPTGKTPPDLKTTRDTVGLSLIELHKRYPHRGIGEYVAFWYKMRSNINLRVGNRFAGLKCALKSIRYKPIGVKPYILGCLSVMPKSIVRKILK